MGERKLHSFYMSRGADPQAGHSRPASASQAAQAPLAQPGRPLEPASRRRMEQRFGRDFSRVRVHSDAQADEAAAAVDAKAYTVGQHIVFAAGRYAPHTPLGERLLAHELAHTVQQGEQRPAQSLRIDERGEADAARAAAAVAGGQPVGDAGPALGAAIQREGPYRTPGVSVRLPAVEEAVRQIVEVEAGATGRPLTRDEIALAQPVFGRSVDYSRVRIRETSVAPGTTVGNVIRMDPGFTIANAWQAEVLIHEMTHVWQYQHGGTGYMSVALQTQIAAAGRTGSRNEAYDYTPDAAKTFFDYTPEQQGLIVQNYFAMRRDQSAPTEQNDFRGNHMDGRGHFRRLSRSDRMAEISAELPLHQTYIAQMRASLPRAQWDIIMQPSEFMQTPGGPLAPVPAEREIAPLRPILRIDF